MTTADLVRRPPAVERASTVARDRDPLLAWAGTLAVTLLAFFLRVRDLGTPHVFAFDETYYAKDAWSLLTFGYVQGYAEGADEAILDGRVTGQWTGDPSMVVHPELGKWLIALGERGFGMTPFGWRIASVVAGTLMVLVLIRLARRLTRSTALGLFAGLLLTFEGQHFVLSRLALLDIFLALFVLCAVSCQVADRDWTRRRMAELVGGSRLDPRSWGPAMWWRPWRLAAGVFWGCAISTKWTAVLVLAAFGLLLWLWDAGARRSFGVRRAVWKSALLDATPALAYVVLLPLLIYVLSWTGWLLHAGEYERTLSDTQYGPYWGSYLETDATGLGEVWQSLRSLWHYHHDVYAFHTGFLNDSTHSYQSSPWGWFLLNRPVGVATELDIAPGQQGCAAVAGSTCLRQVLLLGNPVVWWSGTVALGWTLVAGVTRRDWRHLLILVAVAVTWLPWFRYADRPIFSYYASLSLPFLVLAVTLLVGQLAGGPGSPRVRRLAAAVVAGTVLGLTVLAFAWFWPIWTNGLLTNAEWLDRMWFRRWI